MNTRGDGWDSVLRVSFVGRTAEAEEPTERVSGTDAKRLRVQVTGASEGERFWGSSGRSAVFRDSSKGVLAAGSLIYSRETSPGNNQCPTAGDEVVDKRVDSEERTPGNQQKRCGRRTCEPAAGVRDEPLGEKSYKTTRAMRAPFDTHTSQRKRLNGHKAGQARLRLCR